MTEDFVPYTVTQAFELLEMGNRRSKEKDVYKPKQRLDTQHPFAVILCCSDSRFTPEHIFTNRRGEIFVIRTAGHTIDKAVLGSIEYGEHLEAPLFIVMGHEQCGAVTAAVKGELVLGYVNEIIQQILPAVKKAKNKSGDLLENTIDLHIYETIEKLKDQSPIIKERVDQGKLMIMGARCALEDLNVTWLDPIFNPKNWFLPGDGLLGFSMIQAGPFLMGSNPTIDKDALLSEQPQHELNLPEYFMARYPVTIAQFQAFVDNSQYQLTNQNCLDGLPFHPVVNISWYEAMAYCDWLNQRLLEKDNLPNSFTSLMRERKYKISLPNEPEWEKAARGQNDWIYPWGNEFVNQNANTFETNICTTTTVGRYPEGVNPYAMFDMSGNIWEWTRSLWGKIPNKPSYKYPYDLSDGRENLFADNNTYRVLRGGSFRDGQKQARSSFRLRLTPDSFYDNVGFRICLTKA